MKITQIFSLGVIKKYTYLIICNIWINFFCMPCIQKDFLFLQLKLEEDIFIKIQAFSLVRPFYFSFSRKTKKKIPYFGPRGIKMKATRRITTTSATAAIIISQAELLRLLNQNSKTNKWTDQKCGKTSHKLKLLAQSNTMNARKQAHKHTRIRQALFGFHFCNPAVD